MNGPCMSQRAVLLLNLGSPDSTSVPDVARYLHEFLGDERVIDRPRSAWLRSLLVHRIIIPRRAPKSAHAYAKVWTPEGSPLVATSRHTQAKLQPRVDLPVELAMNYGNPSIPDALTRLARAGVTDLLLFPQYPHYAMSSWETVVAKARREAARIAPAMRLECVQPYYADEDYVAALVESARPYLAQPHDHLLFSYHGIPERHLRKADSSHAHCTVVADCCTTCSPAHATCYRAQCVRTTAEFAKRAGLDSAKYSMSYQSRLAGEPWLTPFTDHELVRLPKAGVKRLLVICPSFLADCLETLEEIAMAGKETFLEAGGESFEKVLCPNDHPSYIDFLANRVQKWLDSGPL